MKKNTFALKGPKGVTLIELTVVIAIILVLISVLFVGANYYRTNANRAACIINLTNMHKAARTVQNISNQTDAAVNTAGLTGFTGAATLPIPVLPTCPSGGTYAINAFTVGAAHTATTAGVTATGGFTTCTIAGHIAADTRGW